MSQENQLEQMSMFSAEDFPVRTSVLPDLAADWLENGQDSGLRRSESFLRYVQSTSSSKTSPAYYPLMEDETCAPSSPDSPASEDLLKWQSWGIASRGASWTLNGSEAPNALHRSDAVVYSLWQVLETAVPPKYYLSARACQGILRRAAKRGKELPATLKAALEAMIK